MPIFQPIVEKITTKARYQDRGRCVTIHAKERRNMDMSEKMGHRIRQLRKAKNISQEVLAQFLGVTFQAVSKWETGGSLR